MYSFYGEYTGVRVARKHLGWYLQEFENAEEIRRQAVTVTSSSAQMKIIKGFFRRYLDGEDVAATELSPPGVSHQWRVQKEKMLRPRNRRAETKNH